MQFLSPNQYGFLSRGKIKSAGKITWLITRCENSFFLYSSPGHTMYFCGRILCGNVPFTSLNGRNITFVLLRIVECTSKTKNYFTWNLLRENCPHRETPCKVVSRLLWTRPFFGGGGMCPLTGIRMNRKFPKNVPSKKAINYFID